MVDTTTGLTDQIINLEEDVIQLNQRVGDLEAGEGGSANVTGSSIRPIGDCNLVILRAIVL